MHIQTRRGTDTDTDTNTDAQHTHTHTHMHFSTVHAQCTHEASLGAHPQWRKGFDGLVPTRILRKQKWEEREHSRAAGACWLAGGAPLITANYSTAEMSAKELGPGGKSRPLCTPWGCSLVLVGESACFPRLVPAPAPARPPCFRNDAPGPPAALPPS